MHNKTLAYAQQRCARVSFRLHSLLSETPELNYLEMILHAFPAEKRMCRRCRFDKCVRLGMELHLRKKKRTPEKTVETAVPSTSSSVDKADDSRESSLLNRIEHEYRWVKFAKSIAKFLTYQIFFFFFFWILLQKNKNSRLTCELRLTLENEYVSKHNLPSFYHPEKVS